MSARPPLLDVYRRLLRAFGPQGWWPGETPFEVMVGAVLTQNTNWRNVERAILRLKAEGLMDARRLAGCPRERLAELIRPAGCCNVKARRLGAFLAWLDGRGPEDLRAKATPALRRELLAVHGIGRETADSILLYALNRRIFVVDAYARRVLSRHGWADHDADYDDLRRLFESSLPRSVRIYNEYHALLVRLGKEFCRAKAQCEGCPLAEVARTSVEPTGQWKRPPT